MNSFLIVLQSSTAIKVLIAITTFLFSIITEI